MLTLSPCFPPLFLLYRCSALGQHPHACRRNDPEGLFVRAKPRLFGANKLLGAIKSAPARARRRAWRHQCGSMAMNMHARMPSPNHLHYRPEETPRCRSYCGKRQKSTGVVEGVRRGRMSVRSDTGAGGSLKQETDADRTAGRTGRRSLECGTFFHSAPTLRHCDGVRDGGKEWILPYPWHNLAHRIG